MTSFPVSPEAALRQLSGAAFRAKFRLCATDRAKAKMMTPERLAREARALLAGRLFPAAGPNDGKQTPMRGHPVFTAQHACACCCRGCFEKWWHVPRSRALTREEEAFAVALVCAWIAADLAGPEPAVRAPRPPRRGESGTLF